MLQACPAVSRIFATVARLCAPAVLMAFAGFASAQQPYPNRAIRIIVPFAPGGGTTIVARLIGQKLSESWGQPVIVDNRPGGNTVIGTEALVKSPPDGYTILLMGPGHVITPLLQVTPYDPVKDFAPVTSVTRGEFILVVHPSVPANNLQELISLVKSRPGTLDYVSAGTGTSDHMASELFKIMAGVKMQFVPYKGSGPAITDLIGGQAHLTIQPPILVIPHIKSGRLRGIAVTGDARLSALPQVPTFTQAGLPGYDVKLWFGILARAGTPKETIDKLSTEIGRIMVMPDIRENLAGQGIGPFVSTPEQFAALLKAETAMYAKVAKAANIKLN